MLKNYSRFLLFFIFLCHSIAYGQENKRGLISKALNEIKDEKSLIQLIPLLRKDHFYLQCIPIGKPLKDKSVISSKYGTRTHPIDGVQKFHNGVDLVSDYANTILSTADGIVIFAGIKIGYGKCVIIEHKYGFETIYAHMTLYYTKKNTHVQKGEVIGFLGSTGKSTGNHLHYSIKWKDKFINPINWLE